LYDLPGLYAVSIKDFEVDDELFFYNLDKLLDCGVQFYITFTGEPIKYNAVKNRYGEKILFDSYVIPIRSYKAIG
jgi:hypothetical protein